MGEESYKGKESTYIQERKIRVESIVEMFQQNFYTLLIPDPLFNATLWQPRDKRARVLSILNYYGFFFHN